VGGQVYAAIDLLLDEELVWGTPPRDCSGRKLFYNCTEGFADGNGVLIMRPFSLQAEFRNPEEGKGGI